MRRSFAVFCWLFLTVCYGQRIRAVPDDIRTVKLTGNRPPLARAEYDAGAAAPSHRMDKMILVLDSSEDQKQALDALITAQQDPASPEYQKWLTPNEFAERFGVSQNDVDQVTAWLGSHGFSIDEVPTGRRTIVFSGTAGMVAAAFHTQIRQYKVNGEAHYANASDPEIPEALAGVVMGTVTLHDFGRRSMRTEKLAAPDFSSGGSYYLAPADFAAIYNLNPLYNGGYDGTGKSIAIVGRTNINLSDIQMFRNYFGLPVNNPQIIVNGTNPGITADEDEAVLDVEWSGAVAKGATIKFVVSASGMTDGVDLSAQYIVANNLAPVMSTSYGSCEAAMGTAEMAFYKNLWQQAAAQGISTMISAGDSGAAGCDLPSETTATGGSAINGLCSSIYSVCVGGTQFNDASAYSTYWLSSSNSTMKESAISYIPEMAWNQSGSVSGGSELWSTGGGVSAVYAKPSWQSGPGVPADGKRDVPDISLASSTHDGFLIIENGYLYVIGGTSAASPSFAGIMAIVNQKTGSAQGNPNPTLYALAALQSKGSTGHAYFHDVTSGSNNVPGTAGYSAGTGYDLTTGLGTVNANNLATYWGDAVVTVPASMNASMSVASMTLRQGASATSMASITVAGGFSNAVQLTVAGAPAGVTATLASGSLSAPGSGSCVLTIAAGASAAPGTAAITVTATGGGLTSAGTVNLTIVPAFALTTNLAAITAQQGAGATVTLTSAIAGGFSGAVVLTVGALPAGVTVGFAPSTISAPGSGVSAIAIAASKSTAPGVYSITVRGTSGSLTNTATIALTVASPSSFTLAASPASMTLAPGTSGTSTVTMTPGSGFQSTVAFSASAPAGITTQLSSSSMARAGGNVTLTAKVAPAMAAGTYRITVTGTGGGVSPSPTAIVTVVVSGFTVKAPATASLARNGSVLVPITTSTTGGFNGDLNMTVTGLPAGVSTLFTPPRISNPAAGNVSMRLTAPSLAQTGTRIITIVATSDAGAVRTTTVSLTVH